jgi:molybdopterin-guanine dinucleotide biosynthesis protein A
MIGIVLAGGASSRFGGTPKGLVSFAGRAMALRAADVLLQVCARVAIEAPRDAGYEALGLPLLHAPPEHAVKGPLAGLATGLGDAKAEWRVAFAPCDMPLLTRAVYEELARACEHAPGAYAVSPAGEEPLVAILSGGVRGEILKALARDELPRTHVVLDAAGAKQVAFVDAASFANVNTPDDLKRLQSVR